MLLSNGLICREGRSAEGPRCPTALGRQRRWSVSRWLLLLALQFACGGDNLDAAGVQARSLAILNGEPADEAAYPMAGALVVGATVEGGGRFRTLGGSSVLIAPDVVLTVAHAVDEDTMAQSVGYELENLDIRWTRQADLSSLVASTGGVPDWPGDAVAAWDWVAHPDYDLGAMEIGLAENSDIGLLFLEEPVDDIPHAYLPTSEEGDQLLEGHEIAVVGWGFNQPPPIGGGPHEDGTYGVKGAGMSTVDEVGDYEFLVGGAVEDVRQCYGDSGGPALMEVLSDSLESWRVMGVGSHTYDYTYCDEVGTSNTRVDRYLEWIDQEMRSRCEAGTRAWCDEEGIVPPPPDPDAPGDGAVGESCEDHRDCESGVCATDVCAAACSESVSCAQGSECLEIDDKLGCVPTADDPDPQLDGGVGAACVTALMSCHI